MNFLVAYLNELYIIIFKNLQKALIISGNLGSTIIGKFPIIKYICIICPKITRLMIIAMVSPNIIIRESIASSVMLSWSLSSDDFNTFSFDLGKILISQFSILSTGWTSLVSFKKVKVRRIQKASVKRLSIQTWTQKLALKLALLFRVRERIWKWKGNHKIFDKYHNWYLNLEQSQFCKLFLNSSFECFDEMIVPF